MHYSFELCGSPYYLHLELDNRDRKYSAALADEGFKKLSSIDGVDSANTIISWIFQDLCYGFPVPTTDSASTKIREFYHFAVEQEFTLASQRSSNNSRTEQYQYHD